MEEAPISIPYKRNIFDSYHMANKRRAITNQETYRRKQLAPKEEPATCSSVESSNVWFSITHGTGTGTILQ